jgi:hypothetical protein
MPLDQTDDWLPTVPITGAPTAADAERAGRRERVVDHNCLAEIGHVIA